MANTLPSLTVLAQEALPVLRAAIPQLSAFTTDFSSDVAAQGTAVATRIPAAMTGQSYSAATGYVPQDVATTAVTVTMNAPTFSVVGFTDAEIAGLTLPKLMSTFITPAIKSVVKSVADSAYALVTSGNYGAASYTGTSYTFPNLYQSGMQALATAGSTSDKAIVLNPAAYYGLVNDIKASNVIGDASVIRDGQIGNLGGAQVVMAAGLPTNSENLFGFACGKEAIAIATRVPFVPSSASHVEVENVTDEESGLTIQLRRWYDATRGQYLFGAFLQYGVAKGNGSALKRLVTA